MWDYIAKFETKGEKSPSAKNEEGTQSLGSTSNWIQNIRNTLILMLVHQYHPAYSILILTYKYITAFSDHNATTKKGKP